MRLAETKLQKYIVDYKKSQKQKKWQLHNATAIFNIYFITNSIL